MAECVICKEQDETTTAIMFCANCGKPICHDHTNHGRYCSVECASEHAEEEEHGGSIHSLNKRVRKSNLLIMEVIFFIIVVAIVYYLLSYFGV